MTNPHAHAVEKYPLGSVCCCGKSHDSKKQYYMCAATKKRKEKRAAKKIANDKTKSAASTIAVTSQGVSSHKFPSTLPPVGLESHSKIIAEINMKQEFEKMSEKFKGASSSDAEKEKKYKYKCEKCSEYFNIPGRDGEGNVICPMCGERP